MPSSKKTKKSASRSKSHSAKPSSKSSRKSRPSEVTTRVLLSDIAKVGKQLRRRVKRAL